MFFNKEGNGNGNIGINMSYGDNIWDSLKIHGRENTIILIYDMLKKRIAATMICSQNTAYFHGKLIKTLYINGLKVGSEYNGSTVTAHLINTFKLFFDKIDNDLLFFSVLNTNSTVLKLFSKKSRLLPVVESAGQLKTYVFKKRSLQCNDKPSFKITIASKEDISEIVHFIESEGKIRANLPSYSREELIEGNGILNGFSIDNLAVAKHEKKIIGIMGLWDQTNYRQWFVKSYSSIIESFRPAINVLATLLGYPKLPHVNDILSYKVFCLMICQNNSINLFKHLFNYLIKHDQGKETYYGITLLSNNPLNKLLKPKSVTFSSTLFKAAYPEDLDRIKTIDMNNLYVEQGSL